MKTVRKFGWFIVCMLVALLSIVLQVAATFVAIFFYTFLHYTDGISQAELTIQASEWATNNVIYMVLAYQVIALLLFGIWYFAAYGKKKRPAYIEKPSGKQVGLVVGIGILLQIAVSGILNLIYVVFPHSLDDYMSLMESSGIGEANVIAMLATVIMAPIGEELLCRGIIFRLAKHVSAKFWVANVIQALAFGIIHANLVQGLYAFAFGLVLGYIYGKYERIWMCMLLHGVINLSATGVDVFWGIFPEKKMLIVLIAVCIAALAWMGVILKTLGPIKPEEDRSRDFMGMGEA